MVLIMGVSLDYIWRELIRLWPIVQSRDSSHWLPMAELQNSGLGNSPAELISRLQPRVDWVERALEWLSWASEQQNQQRNLFLRKGCECFTNTHKSINKYIILNHTTPPFCAFHNLALHFSAFYLSPNCSIPIPFSYSHLHLSSFSSPLLSLQFLQSSSAVISFPPLSSSSLSRSLSHCTNANRNVCLVAPCPAIIDATHTNPSQPPASQAAS